jgi:hypothetical protein
MRRAWNLNSKTPATFDNDGQKHRAFRNGYKDLPRYNVWLQVQVQLKPYSQPAKAMFNWARAIYSISIPDNLAMLNAFGSIASQHIWVSNNISTAGCAAPLRLNLRGTIILCHTSSMAVWKRHRVG